MTWGEFAQLVTAAVVAIAYIRGELRGRKLQEHVEKVATTVAEVKVATNGLVSKIGAAKFAQGDAEGHERGLQQGRDEAK